MHQSYYFTTEPTITNGTHALCCMCKKPGHSTIWYGAQGTLSTATTVCAEHANVAVARVTAGLIAVLRTTFPDISAETLLAEITAMIKRSYLCR